MRLRRLMATLVAAGVLANSQVAAQVEPYPLEYWALRDVISNVMVSPDGEKLALLKIPNRDGNPVLEVYDAGDLAAEPLRVNADPMEITSFEWVSDTNIGFLARQKVRDRIEGFNEGVYEVRIAQLDIEEEDFEIFDETNPSIDSLLPNKPNKIILSFNPGGDEGSKLKEAFRPRAYYEFDLKRGTKKLLIRGKIDLAQIEFDGDGNPYTARGFDLADGEFIWYYRPPGGSGWEEIYRMDEDKFEDFTVEGFDDAKPGNLLVTAHNGHDKRGLWSFNTETKQFEELIYRRSDVDVAGVRFHSNEWTQPDTIVGVVYRKDKYHFEYFDEVEGATYRQLEDIVPYSNYVDITSRSRAGDTLVVYNTGPRDPGTYYLVKDGEFQTIGSKQPLLESEKLAPVEYITYEARDGVEIPAYLTVPHGEPPFPTVVMPHGGPFVTETVLYDEWGQLLANNGYLVLQPQYRGSTGYGLDFYTMAFRESGQGGYKMQDDKDDGVLHLIDKGMTDPERVAMFGWSYGGYAALVAASREPQLYQCVVAGAGVSDPLMQVNYYRDLLRGAQRAEQLNMWDDSVSPLEEASRVNVPMLLIHGDVDQRVPPAHLRKYLEELDEYNKDYRHIWLEGADHFYSTLFYDHQIKLYENLIGYLENECGPGGLSAD
ncbi:MAG: prolyl oligopeptidase family serine peptidase [Woeseiaceae bacterium]|nr:prolyl oligopeptidase family serine peptidase [Woeseiaceae bacterium]